MQIREKENEESYKHLESVYYKASNEVLISSKYHKRYKNNGDFGN